MEAFSGERGYSIEQVRRFASGLDHSEGLAITADGTLYAGGEAGQVYRISPDGRSIVEIANTGGFCLGITLDHNSNVYICDMKWRAVIRVDPSGQLSIFADGAGHRKFRTPNFTVFDSEGNLYLSDSGEWKKNNGAIYKIGQDGKARIFHPGPFQFANGLALNAREDALFVIESNANRISQIPVLADGTAGDTAAFCQGLDHVPDGMAFAADGTLYVGCYGLNRIYAVDPHGSVSLLVEDLENATLSVPTNCAFGGSNFDRLFVSCMGTGTIAVLDVGVRGMPLFARRPHADDRSTTNDPGEVQP